MSDNKEAIQARLLVNIDDSFDKSEGSFFYDAEMPVAIELEKAYIEQEVILDKGFADTAKGVYLDRICNERGIYRKLATKSITAVTITGAMGSNINIGDKVASDTVNFISLENKVIDITGKAIVNVECELDGAIGNMPIGAIKYFPITLAGLVSVINNNVITNGYNAETDMELRARYFEYVRTPATSGNIYHYRNWAKEEVGVGDARVIPLWDGNGTVKIIAINSNKREADSLLITNISTHIEEERPIGATVTVVSATEKAINVTATLVIDTSNYTLDGIKTAIELNLTEYFKSIAFINTYVSFASIGNIIFNTDGVIDYSSLLINTNTANIPIANTEIAVLGSVVVG